MLALPVMIRDGYGQIVYETLPHILLSNASLVTKSCIARFVEGDASNSSALSDSSTGPSPPLAHAKSTLSPSQATPAVRGPAYFAAFARSANKRLIAVGKFERNVKDHPSMSSKLGFRVPRWKRNDTFLHAFVKRLLFFASHMVSVVGNVARDSTGWARRRSASARAAHSVARCGFSVYLIQNPISEVELIIASNR